MNHISVEKKIDMLNVVFQLLYNGIHAESEMLVDSSLSLILTHAHAHTPPPYLLNSIFSFEAIHISHVCFQHGKSIDMYIQAHPSISITK